MAFNMDPKKCPMPTQDPNVRNKNFEEVALGYTEEMAVNEAKRCIHCKNKPCQTGCPVGIDIPEFIGHVAEGDEGKTSREGVYAGGDAVTGAATVIKAMGAGKAAAKAMDEYIQNK